MRGAVSQAQFANLLGITNQVTYHRYESGRVPKAEILQRIANRFGITVDALLSPLHEARAGEIRDTLMSGRVPSASKEFKLPADREAEFAREARAVRIAVSAKDRERGSVKTRCFDLGDEKIAMKYPQEIELVRLGLRHAGKLLESAVDEFDEARFIIAGLKGDFDDDDHKERFVRQLSPYSTFAILKAIIDLTFGPARGRDALKSLGFERWIKWHEEPEN